MAGQTRLLRQIVRVLVPNEPQLDERAGREVEDSVVSFLAGQIGSLPPFIRIPYRFALLGFDWLALLRYGRPYVQLDRSRSQSYLNAWDRSPVSLCRDVIKLLRSCTLLAYLDHPIVTRQLEIAAGLEAAR